MKFSFIKCAGALLAGALLAVACSKDYEADIKRIEEKVNSITTSYNAEVPNLKQQTEALQTLLNQYNGELGKLKETVEANKAAQDKQYAELLQKYNDLDKALKDYATKAELQQAIKECTDAFKQADKELGERIDALTTQIDNKLAEFEGKLPGLVQPYLDALKVELQGKLDDLAKRVDANESAIKTLNEVTIPGIQALVAANKEILDNHIEDYTTFKTQTNEAIQLINDALTEIRGILDTKVDKEAFEEYKETVATLIAGLDSRVAANEKDIEAIKNVLNGVDKDNAIWNEIAKKANQEDFNTFQADVLGRFVADELLIQANATAIANLAVKLDSLDKALNATIEDARAEFKDSLVDIAARITAAYEKADKDLYEKITAEYEAADAILRSDIDNLSDRLDEAFKQISDLSDAFDLLKAEFEALRDDLCSRMAVLEKQMDEILGRIQSVQFVPEYSDGKLTLNVMPFLNDYEQYMALLPVASEVTYKISPADVFESAEQIQEAIDANVLDLNFDVVFVKTRASASWSEGPDVAINKVVNYDPKTGFLTLNVVANPQMLSDYLGMDQLYQSEPAAYVSLNDFMPASYDSEYGYNSLTFEELDDLQYENYYEYLWWYYFGSEVTTWWSVPVYNMIEAAEMDYYKYFAENYAISLEIRRESAKAEEEVESNAINEDEEEGDEYEYNPNGKFDADQKQAIDGKLNNIASPYVVFYPNIYGILEMPYDAYKPTGETQIIEDVNGKPQEVAELEIYEETIQYLPYSATAEYPAYEKNADGKYEPYYYRTPLDGMIPAYEFCDEDGDVLYALTYQDALKLGYIVPALTLRSQVETVYWDEEDDFVDETWFEAIYNLDDEGCTWKLVDDEMTDDRIVTPKKKYFMAPYEEVTLADGTTKVAQDVYATVMMDANTKANVRRNAIDWWVDSYYYVDIAGFGNEDNGYHHGGRNEDRRYSYYWGGVKIVKPNLDVEGTAEIKWVYAEDAPEDHNRAFGEEGADTEYDRALVTINFTDLEFVDKEEPVKVLEYLDAAFNLTLKDFSVADGSNFKIKAAKEGTAMFAQGDDTPAAYNAEDPQILAVWLVDENGKKVTDAAKAKGLAFDINNFEWAKVYNYLATFETDYLDINFKLELTTIDRKHDPIQITLSDHFFDVNGAEFDGSLYNFAETKDKDGVLFRQGMMNGFINLGILSKKEIKDLAGLGDAATDADYYNAFFGLESANPACKYADEVEADWTEYCNYTFNGKRDITFAEDPTTVNANWTAAQLLANSTNAVEGNVYQKNGSFATYVITYVGQMIVFNWNVGYDVPHYDFVHQANYTYYDADKKFYWAQASPDYQNTFGSDPVHKLGHYDVMKMDVYANCFNVINAEGQILDRDFFEEDDRFFNDDAICILFRYAKDNANGVYSLDQATMDEALEADDKMNVGIEYVNGEDKTVSIAKYGDLWVDTTTFYYSSVREQFKMKGFLAVMSDGVRFDIPTSFETANTIISKPNDAVKKTLDIMGVEINGEVPYDEFELRQYVPFEFPDELDPLYINLTQEHRPYTVNLYQSLHFKDIRPDVGTKVINYDMLGWVVVNDELTWDWVVGNGGIDTPSAESNGFQYAPGNGEVPGWTVSYWVPDDPFNPFWNPFNPSIGGHQEDVFVVNPDYIADETVTSQTAYDIKDTFVMDPTNVPVDLRRRITIDEEAHTFTYDYDSQVLFSGEKGVDVSYVLYTRWMRPHTFDFEVVIRGLDVQGE